MLKVKIIMLKFKNYNVYKTELSALNLYYVILSYESNKQFFS